MLTCTGCIETEPAQKHPYEWKSNS